MGFAVIAAFFVLFILGVPVFIAIALPAIAYLLLNGFPIDMIAQRIHYSLDSYPLVAVPVFILVGNLMNSTGVTKRIFQFADTLAGRLHGGLAQVNIFASLIFSGMSGAALADVGGLGQIEITAMKEKGFKAPFAAAVTCASATVGPIFPPSIPLVLYGAVAGVSIVKLLLAGIVPAVLAVIMMMVMTAILAKRRNYPRAERWPTVKEVMRDLMPALPALLAPVLLVAGMMTGMFTPTEAASITVGYVVFISAFIYKEFTWKHLINSVYATIQSSAGILIIVSAASLFGWILTVERVPQLFSQAILGVGSSRFVLLLIVNLILFIVGMFLDSTTATLLVVPIIAPPIVAAGVDPVHLGIIVIFNLMIGLITPPMGLSLFLIGDIAKVSIRDLLREIVPYFIPLIVTLIIITYFPQVTLSILDLL